MYVIVQDVSKGFWPLGTEHQCSIGSDTIQKVHICTITCEVLLDLINGAGNSDNSFKISPNVWNDHLSNCLLTDLTYETPCTISGVSK